MLIDSDRIIPITRLQKELTKTVRNLGDTGEPVYILKNNSMEAVLITFDEYRHMADLEEIFEYFEIKDTLDQRLAGYDPAQNVSWESLKE